MASVTINPLFELELMWWLDNIDNTHNDMQLPDIDIVIYTGASERGWGGTDGINLTGGQWLPSDIQQNNSCKKCYQDKSI